MLVNLDVFSFRLLQISSFNGKMNALNEVRNTLKVIKKFWKGNMVFFIVYIRYQSKVS